ncbi:MAG: AAA family ATPase [Solobacterium sp.]|nr:AAA family ATPase [Solobacterium sp.]
MTIVEQYREAFKDLPIGTELTRKEIVDTLVKNYGTNPSSIVPSDHCYNMINKGIRSSSDKNNFFLNNGEGLYIYVGDDWIGTAIEDVIDQYKKNFTQQDSWERYKWIALGHYKKHWNIDAADFAEMFKEAFSMHTNLLASNMYYPYSTFCDFADYDGEAARAAFKLLYDETIPLTERYNSFKAAVQSFIHERWGKKSNLNHYQDLHAISVYLSFEYPDKYYIYKAKIYNGFKNLVGFRENRSKEKTDLWKITNNNRLCNEIRDAVLKDPELQKMSADRLTPDCYQDRDFHLLSQDIELFGSKLNNEIGSGLGNSDIDEIRYWIYSPGQNASKWKEYSKKGLMGIGWGEIGDLSEYDTRTAMQAKMKEVYGADKSYKMDSLATWQFANELKPGDVVYAKKGMYKIVGRGIVTSDYMFDDSVSDYYNNIRSINWTNVGEWDHPGQAVMKTLTDISSYTDYVEKLEKLFADTENVDNPPEEQKSWPEYNKKQFLEEVYIDENSYETLVGLIRNKMNVILQGAPGVGKTYAANRLAYSIMGEKNKDRVMMVQFHQSYSYEDFIEGFRPASDTNGFEIKKGSFYNFCKKAAEDQENDYFFIIDEINRGNLSKIFGELFMLIEKDKRGNSLQLLYSDEKFNVPKNVYIIGMMNTADRSLAMLDYALRRRFSFFEMKPAFDQSKFIEYRMKLNSTKFNNLIECVKKLNEAITADSTLGEGFCIGHSYFCELTSVGENTLKSIVEYELIPLLKEYWFDDPSKIRDWSEKLRSSIR